MVEDRKRPQPKPSSTLEARARRDRPEEDELVGAILAALEHGVEAPPIKSVADRGA
ncbi:MAG TPA: hypothetical protein VFQ35_12270 [Polyangiaceae bacterium]|nr:hypothetical protein [Polyangiaceae bacterium]